MEDSACARAAQHSMLAVLRTAAAPTAPSSHRGHVEHDDQVSGRTRSGKGRCRSCVPPAREGAERSRTRAPTDGAHLDAFHEDATFDPRDDRRLRDECVLAVVVLRLCLCVPVGTAPPSSDPSVLPHIRSLIVRSLSRLGSRSDRKRRCCGGSALGAVFVYRARRTVCRLAVPPCECRSALLNCA